MRKAFETICGWGFVALFASLLVDVGREAFAQSPTAELARPPAPVTALKQGRNVIISGTTEAMVSAYLMELPQSPRDGVKPTCTDAAQGYVWFTRGSAAADSRTEVCEWRGGTIAWRVK